MLAGSDRRPSADKLLTVGGSLASRQSDGKIRFDDYVRATKPA